MTFRLRSLDCSRSVIGSHGELWCPSSALFSGRFAKRVSNRHRHSSHQHLQGLPYAGRIFAQHQRLPGAGIRGSGYLKLREIPFKGHHRSRASCGSEAGVEPVWHLLFSLTPSCFPGPFPQVLILKAVLNKCPVPSTLHLRT